MTPMENSFFTTNEIQVLHPKHFFNESEKSQQNVLEVPKCKVVVVQLKDPLLSVFGVFGLLLI